MTGGLTGGVEYGPEAEGQKVGVRLFDREEPPRDDKGWPLYAVRLNDEKPCCGSPKSRGGYCESPFRYANGRCKRHGGNSARGQAHVNFDDGKRSKYMPPAELFDRYRQALTDPELTHHRDSIALVDAALGRLFEHFSDGVGPDVWKQVQKKFRSMRAADKAGDVPKARLALEELEQLIEDGAAQSSRAQDMLRLLEARRRHADSETKRKLSEAVTFSYDYAMVFYAALGAASRKHFGHDQKRLTAFLTEVTAIAGEHGVGSDAGDGGEGTQQLLPPGSDS